MSIMKLERRRFVKMSRKERVSRIVRKAAGVPGTNYRIRNVNGFDPPRIEVYNSHWYARPDEKGNPRVKLGKPFRRKQIIVGRGWLLIHVEGMEP
jgi:hypothetical protein